MDQTLAARVGRIKPSPTLAVTAKAGELKAQGLDVLSLSAGEPDFDTPAQNLQCDNLSFNPWHALPEHRPIGGINRLRKAVYEAVSIYRLERNQP